MKDTTVKNIETVSTEELVTRLQQNPELQLWNVLTNEYYGNENIKGSRHVPLDQIGRELADKNLPRNTEIIVYCAGPECPQSGTAAQKLQALGYTSVKAYGGGLEEWEAAGHSIEKEKQQSAACH